MGHDTALGENGHDSLLEEYVVVVVVDTENLTGVP
jgi:hypothetical protein